MNIHKQYLAAALSILLLLVGLLDSSAQHAMVDAKKNIKSSENLDTQKEMKGHRPLSPNSLSGGGDLVIRGGTRLVMTSNVKLSLGGNLTNQGTLTANAGTAIVFDGGAQAMTGTTTLADLVKTGGAVLTLYNPVRVNGTLTLSNGKISLNGNNLTVGSVTGGSATSYVVTPDTVGRLIRAVGSSASVLFPVGNSAYNPVSLRTTTGTDTFRVAVADSLMPTNTNKETALKRTWVISQKNATGVNGNIRFSIQWNAGEQGSLFNRSMGGAGGADGWRWNGTAWTRQTSSRFYDNGLGTYPAVDSLVSVNLGLWTLANGDGALPIELASFTATAMGKQGVKLEWTTISEVNNYGFEVERKKDGELEFQTLHNSFIPGHGTTLEQHSYTFIDSTATSGQWLYRLKQIDLDGSIHYPEPVNVTLVTSVKDSNIPTEFALEQNYPNPFNPTTNFQFAIANSQLVTLKVYDILGREVASLVNEVKQPGRYDIRWNASGLPSGFYFYRLSAGSFTEIKKLLLMK